MPENPIILDIQGEDGFTLDMQDSDGLDFEAQPFSKGDPGKSAYQVAVDNGFSGTEEEWLASLVGPDGYSPTATVTKSGTVATITITDKNGTTTATVNEGVTDYSDLTNKPTKLSDFADDLGSSPTHTHSQYLTSYTETDPVFTASAAHGITSTDVTNWNNKGTYSKPSGGIPKTDLAAAVQTSLGKADSALQSFTETDPTVPSWAKQVSKPTYTASEVGALPDSTVIPSKTSDLTNDSGFITSYTETDPVFTASVAHGITSSDITAWNNKSDFSGSYNDLTDVPASFTPSAHSHNLADVTDVTASASEVNILDGATIPTADLNQAYQGIPYGNVTSNSTTVFTATVPGVTTLKDGTCCLIRNNNKQTSASGWTLNVNDLGAKPVYNNMADATRDTTIFNKVYTMLFIYDEDRVDGGCWICYRGYNSDNNTIGYQLRTNSTVMNVSDTARYYKLYFMSADNTMWVPASVNSTNNATAARPVNQRPINPFGRIVYTSANTNYAAGANLAAATIWDQYALSLGYSFNRTGAALTMTVEAPVYVKCAPQTDGSAIMDADTPIVQALPSTADGKIYIYLGVAYSAVNIELVAHHPVYYHDGTAIRIWTGANNGSASVDWDDVTNKPTFATVATSGDYDDLSNKPTIPTVPTNVSAFTNDVGYLTTHQDISGKINEPATEGTNGQILTTNGNGGRTWTTVSAASDAQVTTAVNTWLGANVAQETGYVLDRTLLISNAAAPADLVGELKSAVSGDVSMNYTEGKALKANSVSHNIIDDADSCVSDFVALPSGVSKVRFWYKDASTTMTNACQIWYFDSSYSYLSYVGWDGGSSSNRAVNVAANAAYARFSFAKNYVGRLTENSATPSVIYYEATHSIDTVGLVQKTGDLSALETTEKSNLVGAINEVRNSIPYPVNPDDTSFFHVSRNMIDPSTCVAGEYVNQATGNFASNSNYNRTGYIDILPSTDYVVRKEAGSLGANFRYAFYNSSKTFISGDVGQLSSMILTSPANAKYIAISDVTDPSLLMIAPYVDGDKSFEAYNNVYVLPKYIIQGDADSIILNLPAKVYALVGYELNIYFDNITENADEYVWDVTCDKGMQLERGYRLTPVAADVGTYTLTIRASISDNIYKEITSTLVVTAASAGSGNSVSVIVLGDSTTYNGIVIEKLHSNFADDGVTLSALGTMGTAPNKHEGRSGWTLNDYFTKASIVYPTGDPRGTIYNPFFNPSTQTFDATYYFANSGVSVPDWFVINMGINDVFGYDNDTNLSVAIDGLIDHIDDMISSLQSAAPGMKIGVCCTIPPNHSQDAFGKAYYCSQTRDRCKRNNALLVSRLIAEYDGRTSEGVYVIPINTNLDTIYNMGMEATPVNARNDTTYQSPVANGGVHPAASGYWQIADVYTAFIKGNV